MNKKRLLILLFIVLAVGFVAFLIARGQHNIPSSSISPSPTPPSLAQPSFPKTIQGLTEPTYTVPSVAESFPASVVLFARSRRPNEAQEALRIGKIFGMTQNPKTTSGPPGTYYIFQSGTKGLMVGPNLVKIDYSSPSITPPGPLHEGDTSYIETATQLLSSLFPGAVFKQPTVSYYKTSGNDIIFGNRASATNVQFIYQPIIENLPLYVGYPKESMATIRLNANKEVVYFATPIYPLLQKTNQVASTISIEQAKARLTSGQGRLLSAFSNQDINASDTREYSFSSSTIASTLLGYYLDPKQEVVSPIFIFYGVATEKTTRAPIETITFVSALP
jgi:hypothetical protein